MQSVASTFTSYSQWAHSGLSDLYAKASPLVAKGVTFAKERSFIFDFSYTSTLRVINEIGLRIGNYQVFDPSRLKTAREMRWDQEVTANTRKLGPKPVVNKFCQETAACANSFFLRFAGEGMRQAPKQIEYVLFYWVSLPVRYLWRQFNIHGGRADLLAENNVQIWTAKYWGLIARISHSFVRATMESLVNVQLLLLEAYNKITEFPQVSPPIKPALFARVARSLGQQPALDEIWKGEYTTEEEKRIAVISWLKENGDLPKGMPDPVGLFPSNLAQREHEALYQFFCKLVEGILDKEATKFFRGGVPWLLYHAEGKRLATDIAAQMAIQVFIQQIADPNCFARTILYSKREVLDIEPDGYGIGREKDVFETGVKILKAVQAKESLESITALLQTSGLKRSPGGEEGNNQRIETRKRLRKYFKELILQMIKGEEVPEVSSKESKPVYGAGSVTWHILQRMLNSTIGYLKQLNFFVAHQAQDKTADYFAGRLVDLIYHPSWKIILLQMIETLAETIKNPDQASTEVNKEDFDTVANFLGRHFFGAIEANKLPTVHSAQTITWAVAKVLEYTGYTPTDSSFGELVSKTFLYFTSDQLFGQFKEAIKSSNPDTDPIQEGMKAALPTINELTLYNRLIDAIRQKGKSIEDDDKFWEVFLRMALPKLVERAIADQSKDHTQRPSNAELVDMRTEVITELLLLPDDELIERLSLLKIANIVAVEGDSDGWVDLAKSNRNRDT